MPPKIPIIRQQSASPVTTGPALVAEDILVVQDIVDTLDAMPGELTRALGDLRELDAVLTGEYLASHTNWAALQYSWFRLCLDPWV